MVLNTDELYKKIFEENDPKDRLFIVPAPRKEGFKKSNAASIDLRLGRWFRTFKQSNLPVIQLSEKRLDQDFTKEHFVRFKDNEFVLHPGKFALGITLEWLVLPGNLAGHVTGKSSLGRRGLIIETAAGVQPGFCGCLTLELANVGEIPIALKPGMKICQVFFHQATSTNAAALSQYKGSRKPGLGIIS